MSERPTIGPEAHDSGEVAPSAAGNEAQSAPSTDRDDTPTPSSDEAAEAVDTKAGGVPARDADDEARQAAAKEPAEGGPDAVAQPTGGAATAVPAGWYADPNNAAQQRYWDGAQWTDQYHAPSGTSVVPTAAGFSTEPKTDVERKAIIAQQIQLRVAAGGRVESQNEFQAVLAFGQPVNHVLHAILTLFTCAVWGIVWAIIAGTGGVKRELIVVDEYGNIQVQRLGKA